MRLRIRDMREDSDFTQKYVAQYLKCDQSLYSKYEREERPIPPENQADFLSHEHRFLVLLTVSG